MAVAAGLMAFARIAVAADGEPAFTFNSVAGFSPWSQGGPHEFTPRGPVDLERRNDTVTINRDPDVKNGDAPAVEKTLMNWDGIPAAVDAP